MKFLVKLYGLMLIIFVFNNFNEENIKQFLPNEDELMSYLGRDAVPPELST